MVYQTSKENGGFQTDDARTSCQLDVRILEIWDGIREGTVTSQIKYTPLKILQNKMKNALSSYNLIFSCINLNFYIQKMY